MQMSWKKFGAVCALAALGIVTCFPRAFAAVFHDRDGAIVQKGETEVRRMTFPLSSVTFEFQFVPAANRWYLRAQDLSRKDEGKFGPLTLTDGKTRYDLPVDESLTSRVGKADSGLDQWYSVPGTIMDGVMGSHEKWKLEAPKANGRLFEETLKDFPKCVRALKERKDLAPYGPMYSVYYPGVSPERLRDAFLANLNAWNDAEGKPHTLLDPFVYFFGESPVSGYISRNYHNDGEALAVFRPQDGGTYLDLDFSWLNITSGYYTKYGYMPGQSIFSTSADDDFTNHVFRAARLTYQALLPHNDYGITLAGNDQSRNPKVKSVNTADFPVLLLVKEGDKLLSINGADVSKKAYFATYMMDYAPLGKPLTFLFKTKGGKELSITVTPREIGALAPEEDSKARRAAVEASETRGPVFHGEGRPEMTRIGILYREAYDPLGTPGHVKSPSLVPYQKAAGIKE
jgi:hypothetical protein